MATTAKQTSSSSVRGSSPASSSPTSTIKKTSSSSSSLIDVRGSSVGSGNVGGEEDIEKIAKQISDHAEAIYQTWKARGLAPTEILNCHSVNSDAFGKTLTPQRNRDSPVNEILAQSPTTMSNSNLKKLVSSFVNEDKARQQSQTAVSARKTNILTSGTIRDALRKFESADNSQTSVVKPNFTRYTNSSGGNGNSSGSSSTTTTKSTTVVVRQTSPQPVQQTRQTSPQPQQVVAQQQPLQSPQVLSQAAQVLAAQSQQKQQSLTNSYGNQLNKNVPDVLINTIDKVKLSAGSSDSPAPARVKPETPAKPASLLNHTPAWPLKNRGDRGVIENGRENGSKSTAIVQTITTNVVVNHNSTSGSVGGGGGHDTVKSSVKKTEQNNKLKTTTNLLDAVLMEEERLINALKTGTVLNNSDKVLPEVITSTLAPTVKVAVPWSADRDDALVKPSTINNISNTNSQQHYSEVDGGQVKFAMKPRHKNEAAVPHPEVHPNPGKTNGTPNPRTTTTTPAVRPFLTRGSVAERVLMFEKRPEVKAISNIPKEPNKLAVSFHHVSSPFGRLGIDGNFPFSSSNFIHTPHQITTKHINSYRSWARFSVYLNLK